ncbi:MAG: hypothetical protein IKF19_05195 [Bacilli bacterium]|nr:hypothetical protein [Bacilli bacterium]
MTKVEKLEKEIDYQLKVYKGKTKKYQELIDELTLYKYLYIKIYINYFISQKY